MTPNCLLTTKAFAAPAAAAVDDDNDDVLFHSVQQAQGNEHAYPTWLFGAGLVNGPWPTGCMNLPLGKVIQVSISPHLNVTYQPAAMAQNVLALY
eukprot:1158494-Pelagomonas_calceolata.AAC.2